MGDNLIIEKPDAQNRGQRVAQGVLTVGFWCLFLSLLRPLLTLFAWLVGIRLFTYEMIEKDGGRLLLEALRNYGLVVLVLAVILRTWAWYNHRRFVGREKRRNTMPPLSTDEIAGYYGVDPTALAMWRKDRSLYVRHNKEGKVLEVQTAQPPPWGDCACSVSLSRPVSPEECGKCGDGRNSPPPCAP